MPISTRSSLGGGRPCENPTTPSSALRDRTNADPSKTSVVRSSTKKVPPDFVPRRSPRLMKTPIAEHRTVSQPSPSSLPVIPEIVEATFALASPSIGRQCSVSPPITCGFNFVDSQGGIVHLPESTPVRRPEAVLEVIGSEASTCWTGEHLKFDVFGQEFVRVVPSNSNECQNQEAFLSLDSDDEGPEDNIALPFEKDATRGILFGSDTGSDDDSESEIFEESCDTEWEEVQSWFNRGGPEWCGTHIFFESEKEEGCEADAPVQETSNEPARSPAIQDGLVFDEDNHLEYLEESPSQSRRSQTSSTGSMREGLEYLTIDYEQNDHSSWPRPLDFSHPSTDLVDQAPYRPVSARRFIFGRKPGPSN